MDLWCPALTVLTGPVETGVAERWARILVPALELFKKASGRDFLIIGRFPGCWGHIRFSFSCVNLFLAELTQRDTRQL